MKNKIIIVGLNSEFNRILAKGLADETQGYYLDIEDYINYSLFSDKSLLPTTPANKDFKSKPIDSINPSDT